MADPDSFELRKRADQAFSDTERANIEVLWRELAEYIIPNSSSFFTSGSFGMSGTPGQKTTRRIFDSVGYRANRDLASAIHSTVTNPATKWAKLSFTNPEFNKDQELLGWLQTSVNKFYRAMNASNFNNEIASAYEMYVALGSMALWQEEFDFSEEGTFSGFYFRSVPLNELAWSENAIGKVDTIYRRFRLTAKQAVERWDTKVSEKVAEDLERAPDAVHDFLQVIFPRAEGDFDEGALSGEIVAPTERPVASYYIEIMTGEFVEEGGYYENPLHIVRFNTIPGEKYGRGPGHMALPDVRTLNKVKELLLASGAQAVAPPVLVTSTGVLSQLSLAPKSVIVVDDKDDVQYLVNPARLDMSQLILEELTRAIKETFFIDKLTLPPRTDTGEMSAFEVQRRIEEMQKALGPTLGRLNAEGLDPIVTRSFNMMRRGGMFDPIPDRIKEEGSEIQIEYINSLSRSQRSEELGAIQTWLQQLSISAQMNPQVMDIVDFDKAAVLAADILGVPEEAIRDPAEVKKVREDRAKQQQIQKGVELANMAADTKAKLKGSEE